MPDVSARTTAKPRSVRQQVHSKILRFSLWVGAIAALFAAIVYIASAIPNVQRSNRSNARAFEEINCAGEVCDTTQFAGWRRHRLSCLRPSLPYLGLRLRPDKPFNTFGVQQIHV